MEVFAANSRVATLLSPDRTHRVKRLGADAAHKLELRLNQLMAASNLEALSTIPGAKPHPLAGDRAGQYAVTVHGGVRLIFVPHHDPLPRTADGGLNIAAVTAICVTEIGDYHRG
ncbi:MAG: type II toxin-antitoxin system RelE/ParE family toxin [Armatimonadota bacterium]